MRVCVIGAGSSGITAAKNLIDEGLEVVVYDQNNDIGGNWLFSKKESHSSVFETTHIISSRTLSQYADYPMPEHYPDYPSHKQLAEYFQGYGRHFELYEYIVFNTKVISAELDQGRWVIKIQSENEKEKTEIFDALVVCNGHHWNPRIPEYPGTFSGNFIHSHQFKTAQDYKDLRVLVIGGGNSACDVAVETSRVSKYTHISWRRGYWIIPKFLLGKPSDVTGERLGWVPKKLRVKGFEFLLNLLQGKNESIGLPKPDHRIFETHSTINSELYYFVRHGKIVPKSDVQRLEGDKVVFADGSSAIYDVVIACTGFKITHPFFKSSLIDYSEGQVPLYLKMIHPEIQNLYFVGLFQPLGCIWPLAELQAKIVARELTKKWERPEDVSGEIKKELDNPDFTQLNSPRHTITVDYHRFKKRLLRELPDDYVQMESKKTEMIAGNEG